MFGAGHRGSEENGRLEVSEPVTFQHAVACADGRFATYKGGPDTHRHFSLSPSLHLQCLASHITYMVHQPYTMAQPSSSPGVASFEGLRAWVDDPTTIPAPAPYFLVAAFVLAALFLFQGQKSASNIPHLNPRKALELTDTRTKMDFLFGSRSMLNNWFRDHPGKPARVISDAGEVTILPPHLTNEIRNDPRLSFTRWIFKVCNFLSLALSIRVDS